MTIKVVLNKAAVGQLLRGPEIQADLKARVERIAAAAGEGFEAEVTIGPHRAHGVVRTATFQARAAEARDRTLTRALDAGR